MSLVITKSVSNSTPDPGMQITYTLSVINSGPVNAENILVEDILPLGVTYSSHSFLTGSGVYNSVTGELSIASLNAGDATVLDIIVNVQCSDDVITNCANLISLNIDDIGITNNSACADIDVVNLSSVTITLDELQDACIDGDNGIINITPNGGTSPYTFNWTTDDGSGLLANVEDQNNLTEGTYDVVAYDANGCWASESYTISNLPEVFANITSFNNTSCPDNCDGSATVTASGGSGTYTYLWSDPLPAQTTPTATDLCSGAYYVTVTDDNTCTAIAEVRIKVGLDILLSSLVTDVSVFDGNDGAIDLTVTDGTPPYVYLWSNDETTEDISGLTAGTYIVTVIDANNCIATESIVINQPESISISSTSTTIESCSGDCNASATVIASGGIPPYMYSLDGTNYTYNETIENLCPGTYNITVTDNGGYTAVATVDVLTSSSSPLPIEYYNITNILELNGTGNNYTVDGDIYIGPNAILTVKNCTLRFKENSNITVQQGARLIVDGSTLTYACGGLWDGITVEGDWGIIPGPVNEDPGPGRIYVKNNSKIEYAKTAIFSDYNGIVKVTDSEFLNCPEGIELWSYHESLLEHSNYPNYKYRATIKRCSFITDRDYKVYPEYHIGLGNSENVGIYGNEFLNINPDKLAIYGGTGYPISKRGKGIYAINSELIVKSTCSHYYMYPCPGNEVPNKFEGLYYGIHGLSMYSGVGSAKITRNEFEDNYRGILLENIPGAAVDGNDFEVGLMGVNPNVYPIHPILSSYPNATYGLYLNECTGYSVQENNFHDGLFGAIINCSGEDNNVVYHNTFENLSYNTRGAASMALNKNGDFNSIVQEGDDGLDFKCNKYKQNDYAVAVANGSISRLQGVPGGNTNELAGNTFERLAITPAEGDFYVHINNSFADAPIYKYYQHDNLLTILQYYNGDDGNPVDDEVNAYTEPLAFIENNSCPVLISNGFVLHELVPVIKDISLILKNKQIEIDDLVDGGKTEYFVDMVENMTNGNFKNVCNELLEASPYLSNEVLDAFMTTDEMFNPVRKSNVIIANSPLPEALKSKIDGMVMPGPFKQLVWEYQAGDNPRELKEQELSIIREEKQLKTNELVREFYADTTSENSDLVIETLQEVDDNHARMALVNVLSCLERYDEASYELQTIEASIVDLPEYKREEFYQYIDLQNIALECIVSDNKEGLITSNQSFLYEIAESKSSKGNIQAQLMLEYAGLADYPEEIVMFGLSAKSVVANSEDENSSTNYYNFDIEDLISIYPNPAKDIITIEYALFESENNCMISIYSTDGKLVLTKPINSIIGIEEVNISNISNGSYFVVVGNKGLNGYVKQIVIKH